MSKKATYANTKIGDIVCLDSYPYKPMDVVSKGKHYEDDDSLCLKPHGDNRISYKWFTDKEFQDFGYIFYPYPLSERIK